MVAGVRHCAGRHRQDGGYPRIGAGETRGCPEQERQGDDLLDASKRMVRKPPSFGARYIRLGKLSVCWGTRCKLGLPRIVFFSCKSCTVVNLCCCFLCRYIKEIIEAVRNVLGMDAVAEQSCLAAFRCASKAGLLLTRTCDAPLCKKGFCGTHYFVEGVGSLSILTVGRRNAPND